MLQTSSTSTRQKRREENYFASLPYEALRVDGVWCNHTNLYLIQNVAEQPFFCGLCTIREGWLSELPGQIHFTRTLADNGNPETSYRFLSHLHLVMGLIPPQEGETALEFRRRRDVSTPSPTNPYAREQFSQAAWAVFPVASALWKLMGYQPPLGRVLVRAVNGQDEPAIARDLDLSIINVHIRMIKAIKTTMGYLR